MKKIHSLIALTLASLTILACNLTSAVNKIEAPLPTVGARTAVETRPAQTTPAPTSDPMAADKACLVNTWEATGLSDYVLAAVPAEMAEQYDLEYKGSDGSAYFTLTPDGRISLQADGLALNFTARSSIFTVPVTVSIDGQANGKYSLDGDTLTTSEMDTSGLSASAQALGEDLMEPAQIIKAIPLISPPFNSAKYTCSGDTLQLEVVGYPDGVPPLVFQAVK